MTTEHQQPEPRTPMRRAVRLLDRWRAAFIELDSINQELDRLKAQEAKLLEKAEVWKAEAEKAAAGLVEMGVLERLAVSAPEVQLRLVEEAPAAEAPVEEEPEEDEAAPEVATLPAEGLEPIEEPEEPEEEPEATVESASDAQPVTAEEPACPRPTSVTARVIAAVYELGECRAADVRARLRPRVDGAALAAAHRTYPHLVARLAPGVYAPALDELPEALKAVKLPDISKEDAPHPR